MKLKNNHKLKMLKIKTSKSQKMYIKILRLQ